MGKKPSVHTSLKQIKNKRQGLRSTRIEKSMIVFKPPYKNSNKTYMDLTGCFSFRSNLGKNCTSIVYCVDFNTILGINKLVPSHKLSESSK